MQKTLIVVLGPTAVGKTALTLRLAQYFGCPVINADSRQLYRDIPIITAAPTLQEMSLVPHYFVGTLGLTDYYSAARYEEEVMAFLDDYFKTSDVALLSGGSMMYIDAVCNGIDDIPTVDDATRSYYYKRYEEKDLQALQEELKSVDPEYYQICDLQNYKRVIHALEICAVAGTTYTSLRVRKDKQRPFNVIKIGLNREREELFQRINQRVTQMVDQGAVEEVKRVLPYRQENSLNTVGVKEILKYIDGEWPLDFALERLRKNTRVYAKKQLTWFKKDESIRWFHPNDESEILSYLSQNIHKQ
jgi:tRNA dimethylallyltransferase